MYLFAQRFMTVILCLFSCLALAQEAYFDSMETAVRYMDEDTSKLSSLQTLVLQYQDIEPTKAEQYANEMLEMATAYNDENKVIEANYLLAQSLVKQYRTQEAILQFDETLKAVTDSASNAKLLRSIHFDMAEVYLMLSLPQLSRNHFQRALLLSKRLGNRWDIPKIEYEIGKTFEAENDYIRAVVFYKKAEKSYEKVKFPTGVTRSLAAVGQAHLKDEDDNQALFHFQRALEVAKASKKDRDIGFAKAQLGDFYSEKGFYRKSYEWQSEALFHYQDANDTLSYAYLSSDIGLTLLELDSMEAALEKEREALTLFQTIDNPEGTAHSLNRIGENYYYMVGEKKSLEYLNEAIKITQNTSNQPALVQSYLNLSNIYFNKKNYQKAVRPAKKAFAVAQKIELKSRVIEAADILVKSYNKLERYQEAMKYQEASNDMAHEMDDKRIEQLNEKVQVNRQMLKKEAAKAESISIWKYISFALIVILAAILFFIYRINQSEKADKVLIERLSEELQSQRIQIEKLQSANKEN